MKLIVANWKMYLTLRESVALAQKVTRYTLHVTRYTIVLCPSFVALEEVGKIVHGTRIKLGAQDVDPERRGAFTGEVGLDDLHELGVQYVLVGHSERRRMSHETDAIVNQKLRAVLTAGMQPILCVGEPSRPNFSRGKVSVGQGAARDYVAKQVRAGLRGVSKKDLKRVVIAYEPVWAIGTGKPATPEDVSAMHAWIKKVVGKDIPVFYGGSVSAKNAAVLARVPEIAGLLVGQASIKEKEFSMILQSFAIAP